MDISLRSLGLFIKRSPKPTKQKPEDETHPIRVLHRHPPEHCLLEPLLSMIRTHQAWQGRQVHPRNAPGLPTASANGRGLHAVFLSGVPRPCFLGSHNPRQCWGLLCENRVRFSLETCTQAQVVKPSQPVAIGSLSFGNSVSPFVWLLWAEVTAGWDK